MKSTRQKFGKRGAATKIYMIIGILLLVLFGITSPYLIEEGTGEEVLELDYQVSDVILILIGILTIIPAFLILRREGQQYKRCFAYVGVSMIFFTFLRLFYLLQGAKITAVSETLLQTWWHLIFYIGMGLFTYGIYQLKSPEGQGLQKIDKVVLSISLFLFVALVGSFFFISDAFTAIFKETLLDHRSGFVHFAAFVVGVYTTLLLIEYKSLLNKLSDKAFLLFFLGTFFIYLVHFWELLTESWQILQFSDAVVEFVESLLSIAAMVSFLVIYWMLYKKR